MCTCARKILVSMPCFSLSVSFSSLRNYICPWIVELPMDCSKCVSMSICDAEIPNLSRHDFRRNATDRFDTMMSGVPGHTHILFPPSLSPTHSYFYTSREGNPPPFLDHTNVQTRERHKLRTCVCLCVCDVCRNARV